MFNKNDSPIKSIASGQLVSEFAASSTSVGAILVIDALLDQEKPGIAGRAVQCVSNALRDYVVLPHLDRFKTLLSWLPNIKDEFLPGQVLYDDKKENDLTPPDSMPREQQAGLIARGLTKYAGSGVAGAVVNSGVQTFSDKRLGVHIPDNREGLQKLVPGTTFAMKMVADELPKLGAVLLLNTALHKPAFAIQNKMSRLFQKMGFSETKARDISTLCVNWFVPEVVGGVVFTLASTYMFHRHKGYPTGFSDLLHGHTGNGSRLG